MAGLFAGEQLADIKRMLLSIASEFEWMKKKKVENGCWQHHNDCMIESRLVILQNYIVLGHRV